MLYIVEKTQERARVVRYIWMILIINLLCCAFSINAMARTIQITPRNNFLNPYPPLAPARSKPETGSLGSLKRLPPLTSRSMLTPPVLASNTLYPPPAFPPQFVPGTVLNFLTESNVGKIPLASSKETFAINEKSEREQHLKPEQELKAVNEAELKAKAEADRLKVIKDFQKSKEQTGPCEGCRIFCCLMWAVCKASNTDRS